MKLLSGKGALQIYIFLILCASEYKEQSENVKCANIKEYEFVATKNTTGKPDCLETTIIVWEIGEDHRCDISLTSGTTTFTWPTFKNSTSFCSIYKEVTFAAVVVYLRTFAYAAKYFNKKERRIQFIAHVEFGALLADGTSESSTLLPDILFTLRPCNWWNAYGVTNRQGKFE